MLSLLIPSAVSLPVSRVVRATLSCPLPDVHSPASFPDTSPHCSHSPHHTCPVTVWLGTSGVTSPGNVSLVLTAGRRVRGGRTMQWMSRGTHDETPTDARLLCRHDRVPGETRCARGWLTTRAATHALPPSGRGAVSPFPAHDVAKGSAEEEQRTLCRREEA